MTTTHLSDLTTSVESLAPDLTLREAAIVVLVRTGKPLRAAQIAAQFTSLGLRPVSSSSTPAQSINRDLHAAVRRGDLRVATGPEPGQFHAAAPGYVPPAGGRRREVAPRGPRLPVEPLQDVIERAGGLAGIGVVADGTDRCGARLARTYHRARKRGWIGLYDADEMCVQYLGLHPCMLWGGGWWETLEEADRRAPGARPRRKTGAAAG